MTFSERVIELNRWYDSLPEPRRILVYPAVLLAAGAINMHWTGSPFGMVFLLALAILFALRRSYTAGWVKAEAAAGGPAGALEHQPKIEPSAFKAPAPQPVAKEPPPAVKPAPVAPAPAPVVAEKPVQQPAAPAAQPQAAPVAVAASVVAEKPTAPAVPPVVKPQPAPVAPPAAAAPAAATPAPVVPPASAPAPAPALQPAAVQAKVVEPAKAPAQASPVDKSQQGKRGKPHGKPGKGNGPKSR